MRALLRAFAVLLVVAAPGLPALAQDLKLPFVLGDDAVLQRGLPVPIWGHAAPGQTVRVEFAGQQRSAVADPTGAWQVRLDAMPASADGRTLSVTAGAEQVASARVLVGEVWLCSGQSNMEKPLGEQRGQKPTVDWQREVAAATCPHLHLLGVPKGRAEPGTVPTWVPCSPEAVEATRFSAIGYFFGRRLERELGVPVGIIHASWGGSRIELWVPPAGFSSVPALRDWSAALAATPPQRLDGVDIAAHYRGMIAPLVPYALRGVLWYQGESNSMVDDAALYTDKMRALIGGWRGAWGEGDFPFYYVQLAPYRQSRKPGVPADALPRTWEAQSRALAIPNTAMVVITDLVDDVNDHHPVRKREVGERLATCALARDYGRPQLEWSGPRYLGSEPQGRELIVRFDHAGGLRSRDGKPLSDFQVAGADGVFQPGEARIDGETVVVTSALVALPVQVRFAWREDAMANLENGAGLPASPFRSDAPPLAGVQPSP